MVSAWIGIDSTADLVRGRDLRQSRKSRTQISSGGLSMSVTTTLKSFASWLLPVLLRSRYAGRAQQRVVADLGHHALELLLRNRVDGDLGRLPSFTFTMSVSSTFTSAVITEISASVISVRARRVLNADHHRLALAHRQVGHHAVKRRAILGLAQHVAEL